MFCEGRLDAGGEPLHGPAGPGRYLSRSLATPFAPVPAGEMYSTPLFSIITYLSKRKERRRRRKKKNVSSCQVFGVVKVNEEFKLARVSEIKCPHRTGWQGANWMSDSHILAYTKVPEPHLILFLVHFSFSRSLGILKSPLYTSLSLSLSSWNATVQRYQVLKFRRFID
jgi:hypothetical protein